MVPPFLRRDEGQTMAEYGVTLGVLTLGVIVTFGLFSAEVKELIERVLAAFPDF